MDSRKTNGPTRKPRRYRLAPRLDGEAPRIRRFRLSRADGLPIDDPWASGESLNYYYFGHWIAMVLSQPAASPP